MNPSILGATLVTLQFGILTLLAWLTLPHWQRGHWNAPSAALWLAGLALGLWAVASNRPGNFNIRPAPKAGGRLVRHGPYRWIRHPMYSTLLLLAAGCALAVATATAWGLWLTLAAVLSVKAVLEEAWMTREHPDYADYRTSTRRFLPWLVSARRTPSLPGDGIWSTGDSVARRQPPGQQGLIVIDCAGLG